MAKFDIKTYLREKRELIDSYLKSYFSIPSEPSVLHEAMRYSLFAGGKRIRPILALSSYEACGKDPKNIIPYASALELIHTYSLIHDDLPAMDNDNLRRGKPTSHKVFGEAMAILAGDALLTEAFFMMTNTNSPLPPFTKWGMGGLSSETSPPPFPPPSGGRVREGVYLHKEMNPSTLIKVIREVALAAGAHGMVGGQALDIFSENSEPDRDTLTFIHLHKTAALITASVRMGPILADSEGDKLKALTKYGENIGLAFQIIDDILDIEGNTKELGKTAGSDVKKMTYPALYGIEKSRQKAEDLISGAIDALKIFSSEADQLRGIACYLLKRRV
ncbi:MAG: polyprenyl synthetase family protein [Thermodesulfovibrionales bacterium]|nr:polyprenyl synthetase family protein [Thermodesulfovibrionales bacterium]